ncbi:ustYa family protein [Pleurotus pulmonarius]
MGAQRPPYGRWIALGLGAVLLFLTALLLLKSEWGHETSDYDRTHELSFSVPFGEESVAMRIATGSRYGLEPDANEEWDRILPKHGHLVHIASTPTSTPEPYTVTLFHQLKCLQIVREQYLSPPSNPIAPRTRHCMNYLRQTLYCRLNMGLESVEDAEGRAARDYDAVCRDWTKLYDEADRNQAAFSLWKERQ